MKTSLTMLIICCFALVLSSCSGVSETASTGQRAVVQSVACIAVIPVRTVADDEGKVNAASQTKMLRNGAMQADLILAQELSGNAKVRIVKASDLNALDRDTVSGLASSISAVGDGLQCDTVMVMTMHNYIQRDGGAYAVDAPASTSFDMRLYDAKSKNVIWAADFNETQESLLSNILSFGKAQQRGFKWITVEELLAQGIKERLADCPYL